MSNEYDFQSYLYPAGSASSGGGAGSGSSTGTGATAGATELNASNILKALGIYPIQRIQALLPQFEAAYVDLSTTSEAPINITFKTPFKDIAPEKRIVVPSYVRTDGSSVYIQEVTNTGFRLGSDYPLGLIGVSYIKFAAP